MAESKFGETKEIGYEQVGKNNDRIIVSRVEQNGELTAYDIRRYYVNDDGEYRPTSKGIRLPLDITGSLLALIINNNSDIKQDICTMVDFDEE